MRALVKAEWLRDFKVEIKMNYYWKGIQAGIQGSLLKSMTSQYCIYTVGLSGSV